MIPTGPHKLLEAPIITQATVTTNDSEGTTGPVPCAKDWLVEGARGWTAAILRRCACDVTQVDVPTLTLKPQKGMAPDGGTWLRQAARPQLSLLLLVSGLAASNNGVEHDASKSEQPWPDSPQKHPRQTIFVYDHSNLPELGVLEASVWSRYAALLEAKMPPAILHLDHDFAEYEVARTVRRATQSVGVNAETAEAADVVFVALWEFGLCMLLHEDRIYEWERQKGILASGLDEKCPEIKLLYDRLAESNSSDRYAFLIDKLKLKQSDMPWKLVYNSVFVGVEEMRWYTGCSTHLPIPYFVEPLKWSFNDAVDTKQYFISFVGSVSVLYSMCEACNWWFNPSALRSSLYASVRRGCEAHRQRCHLKSLDEHFSNRHNVSFLERHENIAALMRASTFCLVPRGDSASTKRFFCAIFALCIPVLVSDHIALPFADKIRYDDFVLRISERELLEYDTTAAVFNTILNVANQPIQMDRAVRAMRHARNQLAFAGPYATAIDNVVAHLAAATPYAPTSLRNPPGPRYRLLGSPTPPPLAGGRRAPQCPLNSRPSFGSPLWNYSFWR